MSERYSSTEYIFNGIKMSEEEFYALIDSTQGMMQAAERDIAEYHGVSKETAGAILYLRNRSSWTQEREYELIRRDKAGDPISMNIVLTGDWDEVGL